MYGMWDEVEQIELDKRREVALNNVLVKSEKYITEPLEEIAAQAYISRLLALYCLGLLADKVPGYCPIISFIAKCAQALFSKRAAQSHVVFLENTVMDKARIVSQVDKAKAEEIKLKWVTVQKWIISNT